MKDIPVLMVVSFLVFAGLLGVNLPSWLFWITMGAILMAIAWGMIGWNWFMEVLASRSQKGASHQPTSRTANMSARVPGVRVAHKLLWRSCAVGIALFLLPPTAMRPDLSHFAATYVVLVIWCYHDGVLSRGRWLGSLGEACGWFVISAKITWLLLWGFGAASGLNEHDVL
jgi:hypothetical protein